MTWLIVLAVVYAYLLIAGTVGAVVYNLAIPWAEKGQKRKYPHLYSAGELGHSSAAGLAVFIGACWPAAIPVAFGVRWGMRQFSDDLVKVDA